MPHTIAILGGGYAGLFAARRAARAPKGRSAPGRVVLVDAEDGWEERTRWHQIAAGETIRSRSRAQLFRGSGVETVVGTVTGIDLAEQQLRFAGDREPLAFDRLVYAPGSSSSASAVPGAAEHGYTLDSPAASRQVAQAVAARPQSRIAVVGGGLTGIQTAAAVAQRYPGAHVSLLSSGGIGHELGDPARAYVEESLGRLGVQLPGDSRRVESVEPDRVTWAGGRLEADLVVWTAGFAPSPLAREAGLQVSETGQVVVDDALRSVSHPNVFAAGDGAAVPRAASAYGAYAATATGATAGANAGQDLAGREPKPLNMGYFFLSASLGRGNAVVQLLNPDGSRRRQVIRGRPANAMKEGVEYYVTFAVAAEGRVPGVYQWSPAPRAG